MEANQKLLKDYSVQERTAYITAITALSTADRTATEDEQYLLDAIAESAELPPDDLAAIRSTANKTTTDDELRQSLDVLKSSDLRFSLMTDLVAFAESDQNISPEEKQQLEVAAQHLNIDHRQFAAINQFVNTAATTPAPQHATSQNNFLESLGMGDMLKKSGIDFNKISGGLMGSLGPILGNLLGNKTGPSGSTGSGGLGGMLGGLFGNDSGNSANNGQQQGGGLGSLISMLNGGRGMGSIGGMLGRMFGK